MAYLAPMRESARRGCVLARQFGRRHYDRWIALVPSDCPLCRGKAHGGRMCPGCLADVTLSMRCATSRCHVCALALLPHLDGCPDCRERAPAFERVIAVFDYIAPGDILIRHLKVGRRFAYASMLAELLAHATRRATPALPRTTILVPVPASRAAIARRGFNPAAEVGRCLARQLGLDYRPDLLLRSHEGLRQTSLARSQRADNVHRLYRCSRRVDGAAIAVVDDVLTTGSTLHSIALEFKAAGAACVYGLVLARTPYRASF